VIRRQRIDPSGARVLVTGAGSGIGQATALRFAELGATVHCVDIVLDAVQSTADRAGSRATAHGCNVADRGAVFALAAEVGPIDILVNNAGVGVGGGFTETTIDDWDWLRGVNLDGVIYGCKAFGPGMVERGRGHIVNVASGAGYVPNHRMIEYCTSKSAVLMFSRCLRADWAGSGVGVSAICPGFINTPIMDRSRIHGITTREDKWIRAAFRRSRPPRAVADAIVEAVRRDRAVVPVGLESQAAFQLQRVTPVGLQTLLARL
jgi:NAD(P)-dependent dehydrogenase (short-subunit alcohol dehydrogenase family)